MQSSKPKRKFYLYRQTLRRRVVIRGLLVLCLLVGAMFRLGYSAWRIALDEVTQRRLWALAAIVAEEFKPNLSPIVDDAKLAITARQFLLPNPNIDIYLLNSSGEVVNTFCNSACESIGKTVPLEFFSKNLVDWKPQATPLYGVDLAQDNRQTVFTVAPLQVENLQYYVYIVLSNGRFENRSNKLLAPVAWNVTLVSAIIIIAALFLLGNFLLNTTFYPFTVIMKTVEQLRQKDYTARAPETFVGELGDLSLAINEMAQQIAEHVVELKDKDRRRMELIANIWHDIRTPLTGISALAQLLQSSNRESNKGLSQDAVVTTLVANTNILAQIVSDLRELGKLEVGDNAPEVTATSIEAIVDEVFLAYRIRALDRSIILSLEIPPHVPQVLADVSMISRVLSNLIENALRYTPAGGRITIRLVEHATTVACAVEDNGTGIPAEDLPFIFEREFQSNDTSTATHGISGLGLAIVKKIVEAHAGSIAVTSHAGVSTRFEFTLPRANVE